MTQQNSSRFGTAFTETIEAREGVTTGISAADRSHTIRTAIDPKSTADLARPGHVFPLRARRGGVLVRAGQTEASVDLARLAGLLPPASSAKSCATTARWPASPISSPSASSTDCKILTVAELIRYRLRNERYIVRAGETRIQTRYGEFRMIAYESEVNGGESHIALIRGDLCADCPAFHAGPVPTALELAQRRRVRLRSPSTSALPASRAGPRAHALHRGRRLCRRLPLPRNSGPVHAHDRRSRLRRHPLPAQHLARILDRPHACRGLRARGRRRRRPSSTPPSIPATSSCIRNCAPAKAPRPAPAASSAPSASAARSSPTSASSASACSRTRPCTSPHSRASA